MGTLTIQTMEENDYAFIRFQDTGVGMSEEVKQKMFDPFFTTRKIGEGTGLGLAIAYGIVQKHKGWLEVSSKEGKGTTVTLYLPLT
jgi:signal transduction histidine kinase